MRTIMYDRSDPRGALSTVSTTRANPDTPIAPAQYIEFDSLECDEATPLGTEHWITRAQNLLIVRTKLQPHDPVVSRSPYEHVVILPGSSDRLRIESGGEGIDIEGVALAVVAPGMSTVEAEAPVDVVRLFDVRDTDVASRARNRDVYAQPDLRVTPVIPWPDPVQSEPIRAYHIDDYPPEPGRFGTMFRTSSFMINFIDPQWGPRDPEKLSPHHHDDFEQVSLAVEGTWTHHIRTPWTSRKSRWREDEHVVVGSPSIAIIPPPTVHTSEASGDHLNRLIDIFSPPRDDFSRQVGWVLNANDYPTRPGLDVS